MLIRANPLEKQLCLVVDDFQGMRTMLRDMLREGGATQIELAANGKEAIHFLNERRFDIVICDQNLGAGRNGQQLLEEAKYRQLIGPACSWIMVTAEKSLDGIMGAVEYQPDAYLIKPITTDLLLNRLEKIAVKKQAFAQIDQAMTTQNYLRALALCDEQLGYDKVNAAELLRLKGQLLLNTGDETSARALFEQVLTRREITWARTGLGRICFQQGDYAGACEHLQACIDANPSYLEAYDWLAKAQQALGDAESAEAVLARALKLSPNSPQRQKNLGELALKRGDLETADKAFRKSIQVGEFSVMKTPDAYIGLARVCGATGKGDEALKVLKAVQSQFTGDTIKLRAKAAEGLLHKQANQLAAANAAAEEVEQLLRSAGARPDDAACLGAAELLLATGHKDRAVSLLQDVVKNNHDNEAVLAQVQAVFVDANMAEEGAGLVEGSKREAVTLMNQGVLLARDGKLEDAIAVMRNAKTALPGNARVLLNFAYVAVLYLQRFGSNASLLAESREALLAANRIAPGDKRFAQLMDGLSKIDKPDKPDATAAA